MSKKDMMLTESEQLYSVTYNFKNKKSCKVISLSLCKLQTQNIEDFHDIPKKLDVLNIFGWQFDLSFILILTENMNILIGT